uniref:Cystatin domain-containing protein n=1 Tax=Angiostrongylus cantonensis TaxID=6313 RepID=A0A0K0DKD8_ANGCA
MRVIIVIMCMLYCVIDISMGGACWRSKFVVVKREYKDGVDKQKAVMNAMKDIAGYLNSEISETVAPKINVCRVVIFEKAVLECCLP